MKRVALQDQCKTAFTSLRACSGNMPNALSQHPYPALEKPDPSLFCPRHLSLANRVEKSCILQCILYASHHALHRVSSTPPHPAPLWAVGSQDEPTWTLEPALLDSWPVSGGMQLRYFIFLRQRRFRAMQRAASQPPAPCSLWSLCTYGTATALQTQSGDWDRFLYYKMDILTYDNRCSNEFYLERQRAGRMGTYCHTSTAPESSMLVLG